MRTTEVAGLIGAVARSIESLHTEVRSLHPTPASERVEASMYGLGSIRRPSGPPPPPPPASFEISEFPPHVRQPPYEELKQRLSEFKRQDAAKKDEKERTDNRQRHG